MNDRAISTLEDDLFGGDIVYQKKCIEQLCAVRNWLGLSPSRPEAFFTDSVRSRMATCLTTRAEGILFGLSTPRFCARLYLDENRTCFLNLRRGALFAKLFNTQVGWLPRYASETRRISKANDLPAKPLKPVGLIADSVLCVPDHLAEAYSVIRVALHSGYGDSGTGGFGGAPILSTPYVQHFWATGLCGHAVAFMAALLLKEHATSIYALAEIAAILRREDMDEILITGLSPLHLTSYFAKGKTGLAACHQQAPNVKRNRALFETGQSEELLFAAALRSYVLSGMPVIKAVDLGRLHGHGADFSETQPFVYSRNQTGLRWKRPTTMKSEHHYVLILGCSFADISEFLIHDPSGFPYLKVTGGELMKASSYDVGSTPAMSSPCLTSRSFIPVTPEAVQMPLHRAMIRPPSSDETLPSHGLFMISVTHFAGEVWESVPQAHRPRRDEFLSGEFRLATVDRLLEVVKDNTWSAVRPSTLGIDVDLEGALITLSRQLQRASQKPRWLWIQRFERSIWVWDAEQPPATTSALGDTGRYLLAVAVNGRREPILNPLVAGCIGATVGGPDTPGSHPVTETTASSALASISGSATDNVSNRGRVVENSGAVSANGGDGQAAVSESAPLALSLITSFAHKDSESAFAEWPSDVQNMELYAFMLGDVADLLNPYRIKRGSGLTAVEAMAALANDPVGVDFVADKIRQMCAECSGNPRISSFATFMPELGHPRGRNSFVHAQAALVFLAQLATRLRPYHPVHHIELVGGSVLDGVTLVEYKEKRCLLGMRRITGAASTQFLEAVRDISAELVKCQMRLAVEAEPGPLFACGTEIGIRSLANSIADYELQDLPRGLVGLNVDIGHYILAGIKPSFLI